MTRFLDVRFSPVGGNLASAVTLNQGTDLAGYASLDVSQLLGDIDGRHVVIAIHGFNVNRECGIEHLSNWERLLNLGSESIFVGVLWPGDSVWAHGLDYPEEPRIANEAAQLIAPFVNANFGSAASISFASHSLGARVVLGTIALMTLPVRRTLLMAGAIDDNCLNSEFKGAADRIGAVSILSSKRDEVLSAAFPLGNLVAGIIAQGHPWWRAALGHSGPASPKPSNFDSPFAIPDSWNYGHGDYLRVDPSAPPVIPIPAVLPPEGANPPAGGASGWESAWSAAFCATRFR